MISAKTQYFTKSYQKFCNNNMKQIHIQTFM